MTPRVLLAVPSYRPPPDLEGRIAAFASSLGVPAHAEAVIGCAGVERARAHLEASFVASQCSHVLWMDDDVRVRREDVLAMLDEGLEVVGLACRKRCRKRGAAERLFNVRPLHHGGGDYAPRVELRPSGRRVMEVEGVGFGCVLVHRSVVERMWLAHPELHCDLGEPGGQPRPACMTFLPMIARDTYDGRMHFVGEDLAWCSRARAVGARIQVLVDAVVDHAGVVDCVGNPEPPPPAAPAPRTMNRHQRRALAARGQP
jgi:hypothetical protein